ncbi:bifunctional aldolase/short-chain dehydrogenase [Methyloceanibacter sp.]|jgi:rhamnose utilization protein RhaD (predicted bifunctional aldolase and dehydrogenase)/NAD(P)-dependent dehydrogenase (short-subunit alcohol dehydrogenase family)|uniref:bifunctional aldolase/short-chain dehydrogenase n=1 Tax=Methyloceanibacter sp. TaxID=1965321 RepID=UPI002C72DC16|nr:bifunctional aldolase/short-chain dehydrogenase [Methyloceanibacter sp.]
MKSQWNDIVARETVEAYSAKGVSQDVALRVYTTRLLGRDPLLVLHGGGNTSVKTRATDDLGQDHEVICVKGSGADMADIEPWGLPAVKLGPLRTLRALDALSDEAMVNVQRLNLLDASAPNPSVETLLHAFLPHKFVDHTHAAAVLSIVDLPDGEALAAEIYDGRMGIVPYIAPGFGLAKEAAEVFERKPDVEGLILHKHGIFTFGETAREAYERMIEMVSLAESRLRQGRPIVFPVRKIEAATAEAAEIAPIIRGACAIRRDNAEPVRFITELRTGPEILAYVNGQELVSYSQRGVVTPDHIIRTKNKPLVVPPPETGRLDDFAGAVRAGVAKFIADYDAYFACENEAAGNTKTKLDPMPRVVLVPGVGVFGLGRTAKDASIAADLAENTVRVVTDAEAIGRYEPLPERDLFALEYWSLEQAKLKGAVVKPLTGQVALVTGAGAIGAATAKALAADGAAVAILDIDGTLAKKAAGEVKGLGFECDVTKPEQVRAAFAAVCERFGGVDILVSNAGAAWQGRIGDVSDETLRKSFELNFFAHQTVAREAVRIMLKQGTGGALLFNLSKQAVNPGANFGPYGLPKAATMLLMRQYALDYGADGIRSNGVNADRIRSGLLTDAMIAARAKARGVSEAEYMAGNLLQAEVLAEDVAQAFVALAKARKTTGHIATVDGGNIAAALR